MIALENPDDANGPEVVGEAEMEDFLHDLRWCAELWIYWARLPVDEALFPMRLVGFLSQVERRPRDSEIVARFPDISDPLSVLRHSPLTEHIPLRIVHDQPPDSGHQYS